MKNIILVFMLVSSVSITFAQQTSNQDAVYVNVEINPSFPGDDAALENFISKNKEFKDTIIENSVKEKVVIRFIVEKDGSLSNLKLLKGINRNYNEATFRLIKKMPKWNPAKVKAKAVRSYYHLSVEYKVASVSTNPNTSAALPPSPEFAPVVDETEEEGVELEMTPGEGFTEVEPEVEKESAFSFVEETPEFIGGKEAMIKYIYGNLKYPENSESKGIEGTVYLGFIVEKDGSITDVKVLRGINEEIDKEAIRLVQSMPKWKPGKHKGEIVRSKLNIPIKFVID